MIITIARQCGCGAIHVGDILAQHYGIPLYTRQALLKMAEEKGIIQQLDDFLMNVLLMNFDLPFLLIMLMRIIICRRNL